MHIFEEASPLSGNFLVGNLLQDFFAGGGGSATNFEPALFLVNGKLVATGEILVLGGMDIGTTIGGVCTRQPGHREQKSHETDRFHELCFIYWENKLGSQQIHAYSQL